MSETIFTGVREHWQPLYQRLLALCKKALPPFTERNSATSILWRHTSSFAEIKAKKTALVIGFPSDILHEEWNPVKTTQTSKNRITHYFELTEQSDLQQVVSRLKAAFVLTDTGRTTTRAPKTDYSTVDEYIAGFPSDIQEILEKFRQTIRTAAPDAEEKISWQMPTYHLHENLIHFAAAKNHISLFPTPEAIVKFSPRLAQYKTTKGGIQFPLSQPVDYDLIRDITLWRVQKVNSK